MWRSYFTENKWLLWSWGGFAFIILSLLAQTYIDVKINEWYKGFYDLLQDAPNRELSEFYDGIALFMKLAIPYVIIYTITNYFTRLWAFRWREAMTFSYMPYWRAVDANVEGASQRIQEDAMNFAKIVESLGLQIVRAIMLLIAFLPILWGLSSNVVIPFFRDISGSLVWVSLIASLGGLVVSWIVGIKLPGLEYNNQKVEAAFRKELVYGEDDRKNYAQAPTILQLFTGAMTLGVLIQTSSAFREVQSSFSLFLQNWTRITELRSIHKRLMEFEEAINFKNKLRKPRKSDVRA